MKRVTYKGMTLLELLVAVAIMAMALSMLYRAIGGGARDAAVAMERQEALTIAQSLLWANAELPAYGWNEDGTSGAYRWSVRSHPYVTVVQQKIPAAVPLYQLSVSVAGPSQRSSPLVELTTLVPQRDESANPVPNAAE